MDGQGTKYRINIAENLNRLNRVHERYRQTTDRRQTTDDRRTYSEREREFTFAKNRQRKTEKNLTNITKQITVTTLTLVYAYVKVPVPNIHYKHTIKAYEFAFEFSRYIFNHFAQNMVCACTDLNHRRVTCRPYAYTVVAGDHGGGPRSGK